MNKVKIAIFSTIVLALFIVTIIVNVHLSAKREAVETFVSEEFSHDLSIGKIAYRFPCTVILKGVRLFDQSQHQERQYIYIPQLKIKFSFFEFLLSSQLSINKIYLYDPEISDYNFQYFFKNH